ncbi:YidB family protein [Falsiroseomonas sp. CW058]|uniref:YidB family protein n=1 Tax=Falsiroseomonas sp. CW058 TaxID=3388664 RepID=UPI003D3150A9
MARGTPSLLALLGVLAVAGYQHRDKLGELLGGAGGSRTGPPGEGGREGGQPGGLAGAAGGAGIGGMLSEGLRDLVDRFRQSGHGETADSWVAPGPNREVSPSQLEQALSPETLDALAQQTGLSRQEIVQRLTRELPKAVDSYTPDGRLPS